MQTEPDCNPKHRSLRLTSERHSPAVRRLAVAFFSTVILAGLGFGIYVVTRPPAPPNPYAEAADLDTAIHTDPRFGNVRAVCHYPSIAVILYEDLADNVRSDLERLVRLRAPKSGTAIHYTSLIPDTGTDNVSHKP